METCQHCQQDLREVLSVFVERRQVLDLPPKRVLVIEHQAQQKVCPHGEQITTATFPQEVRAPVQYSAAFAAVGVYLVQQQLLPYERACELIQDVLGPTMCVSTLQTMIQHCAHCLQPIEEEIKQTLIAAAVLHQDETGLSVAGKRVWMHGSATEHLTHYAVHAKRGQEALQAIGILKDFHGVSVHDGWRSYWHYDCQHACCNVHHLRDLTFVEEQQHQAWATEMKELLLDMKAAVSQARAEGRTQLAALELHDWKEHYRSLLLQANPPDPSGQRGKKGRRKQSAALNLLDRLSKEQEAILAFAENFAIPFDNSLAERDLRMVKVQQKVSGGFRSAQGAQTFARIRGYLSTLRKQGIPLLSALEQGVLGYPVSPAF